MRQVGFVATWQSHVGVFYEVATDGAIEDGFRRVAFQHPDHPATMLFVWLDVSGRPAHAQLLMTERYVEFSMDGAHCGMTNRAVWPVDGVGRAKGLRTLHADSGARDAASLAMRAETLALAGATLAERGLPDSIVEFLGNRLRQAQAAD